MLSAKPGGFANGTGVEMSNLVELILVMFSVNSFILMVRSVTSSWR